LRNVLEFCEEHEIFFAGELVVNHGGVGDVAGALVGGMCGVSAGERQFACSGLDDLCGDAQERGLAGTVAARQDYTFAGSDGEGDAAEGEESAIAFVYVLEAETSWRYAKRSHRGFSGAEVSGCGPGRRFVRAEGDDGAKEIESMDRIEFVTKMKETQEKPKRDPRTGLKTGHYKTSERFLAPRTPLGMTGSFGAWALLTP